MQRVLSIALTSATIGFAAPALAVPADPIPASPGVSSTTGTPESSQIYGIANTTPATVQYGSSPNNDGIPNVTFTGNGNMTIENGFSQLIHGGSTLSSLIIDPAPLFSEMKFAITLGGTDGSSTQNVDVYALLSGQATYTFLGSVDGGHGNDINYEVAGGTLDAIKLVTDTNGVYFDRIKQVSYEPAAGAVPEPATWGMMLLGFAGVGMVIRRRRNGALMQTA